MRLRRWKRLKLVGEQPDLIIGRFYVYHRRGWVDTLDESTREDGWEVGLGKKTCYGGNEHWVWATTLRKAIVKAADRGYLPVALQLIVALIWG
jgi:hypothetical protein